MAAASPDNIRHTCGICLEDLDEDIQTKSTRNWTITNCGHEFHTECINRWLSQSANKNCVICMQPLNMNGTIKACPENAKLILKAVSTRREMKIHESEKKRQNLLLDSLIEKLSVTEEGKRIMENRDKCKLIKVSAIALGGQPDAPISRNALYEFMKSKMGSDYLSIVCLSLGMGISVGLYKILSIVPSLSISAATKQALLEIISEMYSTGTQVASATASFIINLFNFEFDP